MLIACPQCSATYDLPPERLPPGREVRCARCITLWTPVPLEPVPVEPLTLAPLESLADVRGDTAAQPQPAFAFTASLPAEILAAAPALPVRGGWLLPVAWCLTVAIVAGLGWLAVDRRADVMRAWPASERAYVALGLAPRP